MRTHKQHRTATLGTTTLLSTLLLVSSPSLSSAGFLSSSFPSLRNSRSLLPRTTTSNSSITSSLPVVQAATSHEGRYGHSAILLPSSNHLVFLGGQLDSSTNSSIPVITSTALDFILASTFLWGDRPVSAIPDNPAVSTSYAAGLPASAWAATTVDALGQAWHVGGVTEDCSAAASAVVHAYSSANGSWYAPQFGGRTPPRRRQATAVSVANVTTGGTDVWVFGGIAEEFTCSTDGTTVGYVGVDRWDTVNLVVESLAWREPANATSGWEAPVSDYSATALEGEAGKIVVVGGQTAQGALAPMESVLVFDVASRGWVQQPVSGTTPSPRMGHSSTLLPSGSLLLYGGLSSSHSPLSDLFLLSPSTWSYTPLSISDHSILSPSLAWHTATLTEGGTIVVAFGIDSNTATPSSEFWFLTVDEDEGTYTWADVYEGNAAAVANATSTTTSSRLTKKALEVVVNPKASTAVAAASPVATATDSYNTNNNAGSGAGYDAEASSLSSSSSSTTSSRTTSSRATSSLTVSSSAAASAAASSTSTPAAASSQKSTIVGATLGTLGGALALVGLGVLLLRRRAARQASAYAYPPSPALGGDAAGRGMGERRAASGLRPVSTLLYTRPKQGRQMSLGSTVSARPSPVVEVEEDGDGEDDYGAPYETASIRAVNPEQLGVSKDPFSDAHRVNELGQLSHSMSTSSTSANIGAPSSGLKASVQSIPFLSSILQSTPPLPSPEDAYTTRTPTLGSKRSLRQLPSLPLPLPEQSTVPRTPAELIGLAVTSDDGHSSSASHHHPSAEFDSLPYLSHPRPSPPSAPLPLPLPVSVPSPARKMRMKSSSGPAPLEPWQDFSVAGNGLPSRPSSAAGGAGGEGGRGERDVPASLRPGTPLRVANPDPFADSQRM